MTSSQQATLDNLFADYLAKKNLYDIEVLDNYKANNTPGVDPTASNASLIAKKTNMDNALKAYNLYKQDVADQQQAAFAAANPGAAVQIATSQAAAAAEGKAKEAEIKAKAEIESQVAVFAAKNKQTILYVGIGVLVVVVVVVVYLKFVKKQRP